MDNTTRRIILVVGIVSLAVFFVKAWVESGPMIQLIEIAGGYNNAQVLKAELDFFLTLLFFFVVGIGCILIYFRTESSELRSSREKPSLLLRREIIIDRKRIRNIVLMTIPFGIAIFVLLTFINLTLEASTQPWHPDYTGLLSAFYVMIALLVVAYLLLVYNTITMKKEIPKSSDKTKNRILILSTSVFLMVYLWQFLGKVFTQTSANPYMDVIMSIPPALVASCVVGILAYAIAKYVTVETD